MTKIDDIAQKMTKELTDQGKLIEAGWVVFRLTTMNRDAPQIQIDEMRLAFLAGAQHLYGSIMNILDPGEEPTEKDLERMALIDAELMVIHAQLAAKFVPTKGNA